MTNPNQELLTEILTYKADPLGFVLFAFPWGVPGTSLEKFPEGPDAWHRAMFADMAAHVLKNERRELLGQSLEPFLAARSSGHGIGKSAMVAWLILFLMSTRPKARGVVTANTATQLEGKTWAELAKWHQLAINKDWFKWTATKFYCTLEPDGEKNWLTECVPWSEEKTEAFAGLHNASSSVFMIFDEASAIPDKIWEVAEGAMTDGEPFWFAFGNPTRNTGRFRECFGKRRHRWNVDQIDSRSVRITNKSQLQRWVDDEGEDSDFVRVRVKGQFPRAGASQFIPTDTVEAAQEREVTPDPGASLVMGVDVARFGDDQSVICFRRGLDARSIPMRKYRGLPTSTLVGYVAEAVRIHNPTAIFVDGGGVGGGVVDQLRQLGYRVVDVQAGGSADDKQKYINKRVEMWGRLREWLTYGCLPADRELYDDLIGPEYKLNDKQQIQLERKDEMKKRGLGSPDSADALALTFAQRVARADLKVSRAARRRTSAKDVEYSLFG